MGVPSADACAHSGCGGWAAADPDMTVRVRPTQSERGSHAAEVDRPPLGECGATPVHLHEGRPVRDIPIRSVGNHITTPSAAMTSALRGWPLARCVISPPGPSTKVVGVRMTPYLRTRSSLDSASISTYDTPSTIADTSDSIRLVARHGAQKAEENCTRVARLPSEVPMSPALIPAAGGSDGAPSQVAGPRAMVVAAASAVSRGAMAFTRPLRARHVNPNADAAIRAHALTTSPGITAG